MTVTFSKKAIINNYEVLRVSRNNKVLALNIIRSYSLILYV